MHFRRMMPHMGYRNEYLWLPREGVKNIRGVKTTLTFPQEGKASLFAYDETDTHIMVPREYLPFGRWFEMPFEIEDRSFDGFPTIDVEGTAELRGPVQRLAYSSLLEKGSGVLSLPCGKGKTVVALLAWTALEVPGLIVVHTKDLLEQWIDRIVEHTSIKPHEIGVYAGDRSDWEKPICVASIRTLAARVEADELPEGFQQHFGVTIYDEVHHLGAPFFNLTASVGLGIRWGLSATPERGDGLDKLYQYHLGDILYVNREYDVIPEVFFIRTGIEMTGIERSEMNDRAGQLNDAKLLNWLAAHEKRNHVILRTLDDAISEGRCILALSARVEHLKSLAECYEGSGLIHGKIKGVTRKEVLQTKDLIFATTQLAQEGLDRKDLDTIAILLPLTKESVLRQILGRIQRLHDDKKPPIAVIFEDAKIPACLKKCQRLRYHLDCFEYPYHIVKEQT